ncbi:pilus assembly PilX N-terminal domain-containing protein [Ramlibacter sp. USB13]|uniref:Pilus assembly PilX N-terminal domain-containing protein n=1 Tax=Ramlibacter cellulosilyticus TaxID=2764187 RepID=A0A923SD78_9BURK|nr:PilX N-terminal domain-containing pilus assembly protein [Ramlibacter cellulosilyticus]MBC5781662.1 pilus assembly PilX N-terminal domain-containing protein [Ramlibacter cellulosilyticus]
MNKPAQDGSALVVALIFLVLMSLFAISAFDGSSTNMRVVGNMQARQEAIGAAQVAIEQTLSSPTFSSNPDIVAANAVNVDVDGNGTPDYKVTMTPQPKCYRARAIKTVELDAAVPADLACMKSGVVNTGGLDDGEAGGIAGNSLCSNTEWNVRAQVLDERSGAQVAVNQGVAIRVLETDAMNSCK